MTQNMRIDLSTQQEMLQHLIWQMPGIMCWKDRNSIILGSNQELLSLTGLKKLDQVVGMTDYDVPTPSSEQADIFIAQDQKAMEGQRQVFLDVCEYSDGELHTIFVRKSPLCDLNGNIIGVICNGTQLHGGLLNEIGNVMAVTDCKKGHYVAKKMTQVSYTLGGVYNDYNLTGRESACLFYLIRGKTAKEIAKIFDISYRTVEEHIRNMRHKLQLQSSGQLIEFAVNHGFLFAIPPCLVKKDLLISLK